MKAVVFAYHDMGCAGIQSLLDAGYDIAAIFTHPDNPGENHFFGSVARIAAEQGIPVWAPEDVNHPLMRSAINEGQKARYLESKNVSIYESELQKKHPF